MEKKERKKNRLKNFDYSQNGAYFITICTNNRKPILSEITVGATCSRLDVQLSEYGEIIDNELKKLNTIYENVYIDNYVIMPNHIHMIIRIESDHRRLQVAPTIIRIIKQFKMSVTKQIGTSIWQKGYYDHVIRDNIDYMTKYQYIDENPAKWDKDKYYH